MSTIEIKLAASKMLIKINIITGWNFPAEKEHMQILKDQFEKKLIESYGSVNMDEIEFAFRNYPIKDWGKNMNLNLIDEVMEPYLVNRFEVSQLEEAQIKELPAPKEEITLSEDEWVEMDRSVYRLLKNYRSITQTVVKILYRQKKIAKPSEEDCVKIKTQATHDFHEESKENSNLKYRDKEDEIRKIMNQILVAKYFNEENK